MPDCRGFERQELEQAGYAPDHGVLRSDKDAFRDINNRPTAGTTVDSIFKSVIQAGFLLTTVLHVGSLFLGLGRE